MTGASSARNASTPPTAPLTPRPASAPLAPRTAGAPLAPRIPLWVDLRAVPVNKRLGLLHAIEAVGAEHALLAKGDPHLDRPGLKPIVVDAQGRLRRGREAVGKFVKVRDARSQARAAAAGGIVVVEADDWRVIPLENLVAARAGRPGTLYALAHTPEEAALFAQVLETGVHGIVLAAAGPADLFATDRLLRALPRPVPRAREGKGHADGQLPPQHGSPARHGEGGQVAVTGAQGAEPLTASERAEPPTATRAEPPTATRAESPSATRAAARLTAAEGAQAALNGVAGAPVAIRLEPATITRVGDGGIGDRVCVDCTSMLHDGEGLLVGSAARSLALVHAETAVSELAAPRAFRVNAGAVHSYVLAPGNRTRYLGELEAGAAVLAVSRDGSCRAVTVGRCKVERRAHTLVQWHSRHGPASALLQTAETVRLVRPDGTTVCVTDLRPGDTILVHASEAARHFGMPIEESLEER